VYLIHGATIEKFASSMAYEKTNFENMAKSTPPLMAALDSLADEYPLLGNPQKGGFLRPRPALICGMILPTVWRGRSQVRCATLARTSQVRPLG
jgi:hypothetical protein